MCTSPEWFLDACYKAEPTTVWQLGIVLYSILHTCFPFENTPEITCMEPDIDENLCICTSSAHTCCRMPTQTVTLVLKVIPVCLFQIARIFCWAVWRRTRKTDPPWRPSEATRGSQAQAAQGQIHSSSWGAFLYLLRALGLSRELNKRGVLETSTKVNKILCNEYSFPLLHICTYILILWNVFVELVYHTSHQKWTIFRFQKHSVSVVTL